MDRHVFLSRSPAATFSFGRQVGEKLEAGSILALIGELGCGKTLFTKGICAGVGVPKRYVSSPTFVMISEYSGRIPVFHMDLYRLSTIAEEFDIGILDYLAKADSAVMVVEWAEKILPLLPGDYLEVQFQVIGPRRRQLVLSGHGGKFSSLFGELGD